MAKLRSDYGRNDEIYLEAAIAETLILIELGRENEAQKSYADASRLYEKCEGALPSDVAMEMANACIVNGDKERGLLMPQSLVKNNLPNRENWMRR